MSNTTKNGDISELAVQKQLLEKGYSVSVPISHEPYDLIVDVDRELVKVQVKRCWEKGEYYAANFSGTTTTSDGQSVKKYSEDEVDVFAVHNPNTDEVYWLEYSSAPTRDTKRLLETWQSETLNGCGPLV